jgi:hypothetical protein
MEMHSSPLAGLTSFTGHVAKIFVAIGGAVLLLDRFSITLGETGTLIIWLFWPALAVWLTIIIALSPTATKWRATNILFERAISNGSSAESIGVAEAVAFFLVLFAILLWKNLAYLKTQFDIRWHIAFLNYDLAWHTPIFSLSGNILYQFEIQPPFNTSLAPLNGIAHLVSPGWQIVASYILFYLAMTALLWALGCAVGLKPVPRAICAALAGLMTTIPYGLDHLLPFLPPPFVFVSQAMLTRVYEELGILSLTTVVLFFWIGQRGSFVANIAISGAFCAACYVVLLAYPALAFFSTPVIFLYCCAFLATAANSRELWWKLAVGAILLATMLAARIPIFFKELYSYTYGAYFSDRIMNSTSRFTIWRDSIVLGVFWPDAKVLLLCLVSCASAIFFAVRGDGAIRRFAVGMLVGEAGVFTVGGVMAYLHYPVSLYYSDQLQAPIPVFFFLMPLMFGATVLATRFNEVLRDFLERAKNVRNPALAISNRRNWCATTAVLFLAITPFLVPRERPFDNSAYPPAQPPSVKILESELQLSPGKTFAGRTLTLVGQDLPAAVTAGSDMNPLLTAVLDVLENRYGRHTGNDHWIDLLNLNIPVVGEYGQWATPVDFLLMHAFFARQEDVFQKSLFILRAYNDRVAHMIGIRYVVTDAANIPGGTMVYEAMAGDTPLRLFRIDDTNLGQYSPTRPIRITTAAEGLATIGSAAFDPKQSVLVEQSLPADLVPGRLQSLTVEYGPALHVQAESPGTSLLVLPFEYSHCLRVKALGGNTAQLIPVNLQQTGLLFDRRADVEITYRFGLFADAACRGEDLARMDTLQVRKAFE